MNTKEIVWKLFKEWILEIAKKGKKTLDFYELLHILHVCGEVYDNRTAKNYIECMMNNHWLIPDDNNLLPLLVSSTSVYKYKRVKWTINEQATYNGVTKDEILSQITSG
jgi:hypothetical protein